MSHPRLDPTDAVEAGSITLDGAQGDRIEAYLARPTGSRPRGGVVLFHHMPGYDEGTKEMARRLATYGFDAVCPNLYSREAPGAAPDDAAAYVRTLGGVPDDRVVADTATCLALLRGLPDANGRVAVMGHCSGGRHTFLTACSLEVDAAVNCYGAFVTDDPPADMPMRHVESLIHLAPRLSGPMLGLFGADDRFPDPNAVRVLGEELDRLGKEHEFHTYPDAGHSFFDVASASYRPAAARDGWATIRSFLGRTLGNGTAA